MQAEPLFERNPDYVYRRIVDESVLVPIHRNVADMDCIYTLNPTGAFIWERLEKATSRSALQAALLEEYAADPDVLAADLEAFLQEMLSIGAVREV